MMIPDRPPVPVAGYYCIGIRDKSIDIMFGITVKPNWWHRTMAKLFFGIIWRDA